ncbi:CRISPR-associated protein (Cas_Cas5) [Peptococcaceae bacterium CEB3]|nr:CRISPR-associated protein (Cas_Cas5) [Peptococcaceae bacterium CEB3]
MNMAILVILEGIWAHYRSAWTNHSNALSYPAPPRSSLLGMAGAALGLAYREIATWDSVLEMGFMWDTAVTETVTQVRRYKIETPSEENYLKPLEYTKNPTLDTVSYLHHPGIPTRLRGKWLIVAFTEKDEAKLYEALVHPVYPLSFGSSEALARIVDVRKVEANRTDGPITTLSSVPCDELLHSQNAVPSVMARRYQRYGEWLDHTRVWTPIDQSPLTNITPKFGAYKVGGDIFAVL